MYFRWYLGGNISRIDMRCWADGTADISLNPTVMRRKYGKNIGETYDVLDRLLVSTMILFAKSFITTIAKNPGSNEIKMSKDITFGVREPVVFYKVKDPKNVVQKLLVCLSTTNPMQNTLT